MPTFNLGNLTISSDPANSPEFALTGQTHISVSIDNTPMTASQSFDWKCQFSYDGGVTWRDGGGQHVPNGLITTKSGGTTHTLSFQTDIPASPAPDHVRAEAYNVVGAPVTINSVVITVT